MTRDNVYMYVCVMKDVASPLSDIALYLLLMYGKYFLPEKGSGCVKRAERLGTQKSLV